MSILFVAASTSCIFFQIFVSVSCCPSRSCHSLFVPASFFSFPVVQRPCFFICSWRHSPAALTNPTPPPPRLLPNGGSPQANFWSAAMGLAFWQIGKHLLVLNYFPSSFPTPAWNRDPSFPPSPSQGFSLITFPRHPFLFIGRFSFVFGDRPGPQPFPDLFCSGAGGGVSLGAFDVEHTPGLYWFLR